MRSIATCTALISGLLIISAAVAEDMPPLARKHDCNACHAIDKQILGPAWREVAKKYNGDPNAEAYLTRKVAVGGGGIWGTVPMPANDPKGKKHEDMTALVKFILALAK